MKFDFPKKQSKVGVTVMVTPAIVEKVKLIAENNQSTIIGVYETLLTEAVEEYEKVNGEVELDVELVVLPVKKYAKTIQPASSIMNVEEDVNYDNKFMSNKKEKKPAQSFCQNANCPNKGQSFNKAEMIEVMDFLVCTDECAEVIKGTRIPVYS